MTTQYASASYQEIVDLHTESDTVSVIGIHTPQGDTPRKMFGGFFDQFKKFKYLGCSIKLVPAARLPADPLQVSAQYNDYQTIDPRDMLNPLMFHGCHGNDMGVILNRLYSLNSVDGPKSDSIVMEQDTTAWTLEGILAGEIPNFQLEDLYYKALTDNTWKKAHPQRGFRKSGLRPLVYKMSTNMQMLGSGQSLLGVDGLGIPGRMIGDDGEYSLPVVQSGRQFFTPGLTGLGWLDTRNVLTTAVDVDYDGSQYDDLDEAIPAIESAIRNATLAQQNASESSLPLVYMGMILLPPAYKTEQYFRMIINHHFAFKDFRGISFSNNLAVTPAYDNFNVDDGESVDPPTPDPDPDPTPDPDPDPDPEPVVGIEINSLSSSTTATAADVSQRVFGSIDVDIDGTNITSTIGTRGGTPPYHYFVLVDPDTMLIRKPSNSGSYLNSSVAVLMISANGVYGYINGQWYTVGPSVSDATVLQIYLSTPAYNPNPYWSFSSETFLTNIARVCTTDVKQSISVVI